MASLLHDIGYIGVPDQVLLKPGPLDADETRIVEQSAQHLGGDPPQRARRAGGPGDRGKRGGLV